MGYGRSLQVLLIVAALAAVGLGVFFYKYSVLGFPLDPDQESASWAVETRLSLEGSGEPVTVSLALPQGSETLGIADEDAIAEGFGVTVEEADGRRYVTLERRSLDGYAVIYLRSRLFALDAGVAAETAAPRPDGTYGDIARAAALGDDPAPFLVALDSLIQEARQKSADRAGLIRQIARLLEAGGDRVETLATSPDLDQDLADPARRLAFVLEAAGIPARRVVGLSLESDRRLAAPRAWTELWTGEGWQGVDPATAAPLAANSRVVLARNDAPLITTRGAVVGERAYAVRHTLENRINRALWHSDREAPLLALLSPFALTVDAQLVFQVMLLLPVGALVVALLRQVVGLKTFGTFMPVLIALSFRETRLDMGIALFVAIVAIGLFLRSYFNHLQLMLVPRLASVLTIVTLIMLALAIGGRLFGLPVGLSLSLFPLVILTMTIESMSLIWDEYGAREALIRGTGSLVAAVVGWFAISQPLVAHLVFVYPELLLVILALLILLGRYNGYTLFEYIRFRMLRPEEDYA